MEFHIIRRLYDLFSNDLSFCHRSVSTKNSLIQLQINIVPWPADVLHLNPIGNLLGIVKKKFQIIALENTVDFICSIKLIWSYLDRKDCEPLVTSLPYWVHAVVKCKSDVTKCLKNHCFLLFSLDSGIHHAFSNIFIFLQC